VSQSRLGQVELHIDLAGRRGHRDEIYRQVRTAILDGRIRAGEALPPTRELAQRLSVSRTTVSAAYDRLAAEGFLAGRVGAGTFVTSGPPSRPPERRAEPVAGVAALPEWDPLPDAPRPFTPAEFDLRPGVPDLSRFPFDTWRRLLTQRLRAGQAELLSYGDAQGHPALRAEIVRHLGVSRDVRAGADQVVVTAGAQQTTDLIARVLLRRGELAAVEDPGYPPPRLVLTALGIRVAPVPVDGEGIVVSAIPPGTRLVHVTPSHQFPLGVSMSLARRMELLEWADRNAAVLIEDDYDTEFRYGGRPLEPLHSLDPGGRVIYVSSFSKVLSPALRLGFLIAPPALIPALRKAKYLADWHAPTLEQAALAEFMAEGGFARHIRRTRKVYRDRRELLSRVLARDFADVLTPVPSTAGLHLAATAARDPGPVLREARRHGVRVHSLGSYCVGERRHGVVFGFGAITTELIEPGLARLREPWGAEFTHP
jgi:GntR family transcriptional regulator/MocR family aminotransferase